MNQPTEPPSRLDFHVFVSYARADNVSGWVTQLVERLKGEFRDDCGGTQELRVFFDKEAIREGRGWEEEIRDGLHSSRVFIAVISPTYFASDWCLREWEWWAQHEVHRHCLRDGAAPIYLADVEGFPASKSAETIAQWIVTRRMRFAVVDELWKRRLREVVGALQARQAYDFRTHARDSLVNGADAVVETKLRALCTQVRELLARHEAARRSPTELPAYNPAFTGRGEQLLALRHSLGKGAAAPVAVVHGLGGMGKTELVLAFGHAYGHEYPGGRYFIPCAGAPDWHSVLERFAGSRGWDFDDKVKCNPALHFTRLVSQLHKFAEAKGRCFLMCDNIDSPALLRAGKFAELRLRSETLHFVITTRLPAPGAAGVAGNIHWQALDSLSHDEAVALLEAMVHSCPEEDRLALSELARELGGFTIAIELAGRHLACNEAETPRSFLARLRAAAFSALDPAAKQSGADLFRHGEEARLDFILGQQLASLGQAEIRVLEYAAELAPDAVPHDWLRVMIGKDFPEFSKQMGSSAFEKWGLLMERLVSLRLLIPRQKQGPHELTSTVDSDIEGHSLARMHRLVQEVVRSRCGAVGKERRQVVTNVIQHMCVHMSGHWHEPKTRWVFPVIESLADAWLARAERGERALAFDAMGVADTAHQMLSHLAAWARAEPLLLRTRALIEQLHGSESDALAPLLNNLAELLRRTNRLPEAEALFRQALAIGEKNLGLEHVTVASRLTNLATLLRATNRMAEAESLLRRAVSIYDKTGGDQHPNAAIAYTSLANQFVAGGRLADAEQLYRKSLAIGEKTLGPNHPTVGMRLNNLAFLLIETGRINEAEPMIQRALNIGEMTYGAEHPHVAMALVNLGRVLAMTNRVSEAESLLRRALVINEKYFGANHPEVAVALNGLASILKMQHRMVEAAGLYRRVLIICCRFVANTGRWHADHQAALQNFQSALIQTGVLPLQAQEQLRAALAEGGRRVI